MSGDVSQLATRNSQLISDNREFPFSAEEFACFRDFDFFVAADAAFKRAELVVSAVLQAAEPFDETGLVLSGNGSARVGNAACQVNVLEIRTGGNERAHHVGFFNGHVIEVSHDADAFAVVDVSSDSRAVGNLTQEVRFAAYTQ